KKSADPIKVLEKKYLYKEIELIDNLNSTLKSGLKGAIIEVIDEHRFFAEFYDLNGHQMEYNGEFVFKIGMNQFKLKR
ncbi:MAG: hypothetical protein KDC47_08970, partial [Flavobacteriaceae bacterium]|nr:hypothetical protein [Flavobacteriaceae bacterium]